MADTNVVKKDLGPVSAYAIAVKHGYKGTEEEWAALLIASEENAKAADASAKEAAETLAAVHETVEQETDAAVAAVNNQETASIQSVKDAAQAAGAYQEEQIAVKGEQTLASIPDDYTKLGQDVAALTEDIDQITEDMDNLIETIPGSANVLDPDAVVRGSVSISDGSVTEAADGTYMVSELLDIPEEATHIYLYWDENGTPSLYDNFRTWLYNADKHQIAYIDGGVVDLSAYPEAAYARARLAWAYWTNGRRYGVSFSEQTVFEPYTAPQKAIRVVKTVNGRTPDADGNLSIPANEILADVYHQVYADVNLLDNTAYTAHAYLQNDGVIKYPGESASAYPFCLSDYIPVIPGKTVYAKAGSMVVSDYFGFFDENKSWIGGETEYGIFNNNSKVYWHVVPDGAAYMRVSHRTEEDAISCWISYNDVKPTGNVVNASRKEYVDYHYYPTNPCDYNGKEICVFSRIVCGGDSITSGYMNTADGGQSIAKYSYPAYLQKLTGIEVVNLGDAGETSVSWWENHSNDDFTGYDCAIINLGINDALQNVPELDMRAAFANIINALKTANNGIKIFVANVCPAYARDSDKYDAVNAIIQDIAEDTEDCYFIDLTQYGHAYGGAYVNGHLTALGYLRQAEDYVAAISYIIKSHIADNDFKYVQFIGTDLVP